MLIALVWRIWPSRPPVSARLISSLKWLESSRNFKALWADIMPAPRDCRRKSPTPSDHYKPVGPGDEVPTAPVTVAVSLADKLDSIAGFFVRSEEHTSELQSLMRISYAVFCLKKKKN